MENADKILDKIEAIIEKNPKSTFRARIDGENVVIGIAHVGDDYIEVVDQSMTHWQCPIYHLSKITDVTGNAGFKPVWPTEGE